MCVEIMVRVCCALWVRSSEILEFWQAFFDSFIKGVQEMWYSPENQRFCITCGDEPRIVRKSMDGESALGAELWRRLILGSSAWKSDANGFGRAQAIPL